jgi:hypothetical protein
MIVYTYDAISGEYLGQEEVYLDLHMTKLAGKDIYQMPASSTTIVPPQKQEGFAPCFFTDKNAWIQVEDHRGKTIFKKEDLSSKTMMDLGPIPLGYFEELPQPENRYQTWEDGKYVYIETEELRGLVKIDLDAAYEKKLQNIVRAGSYYVQPSWATIYTNTLVAMQQDVDADGVLDNTYKILLITNKKGNLVEKELKSISEFMPYYNKVKETFKALTEAYHSTIIKIEKAKTAEELVDIILNY